MDEAALRKRFAGPWIGETQGCESPAHLWSLSDAGSRLFIRTSWEGADDDNNGFDANLIDVAGLPAFHICNGAPDEGVGVLVDAHHFIIPRWDTKDTRGNNGPDFDVVFSRPGVAELNARDVWRNFVSSEIYHAVSQRNAKPKAKRKRAARA